MSELTEIPFRLAKTPLMSPPPAAGVESYRLIDYWVEAAKSIYVGPASARPTLEDEIASLARWWKHETAHLSSIPDKVAHPAYQQIVGKGRPAVPVLLKLLTESPDHWFSALTAITGVDPVPPDDWGRIRRMAEAWIQWGREQGMI